MFINFDNVSVKKELFSGTYEIRYSLESKDKGHVGSIYFTKDTDGIGYVELCRGSTAKGFGEKVTIEELFDLLESRNKEE